MTQKPHEETPKHFIPSRGWTSAGQLHSPHNCCVCNSPEARLPSAHCREERSVPGITLNNSPTTLRKDQGHKCGLRES